MVNQDRLKFFIWLAVMFSLMSAFLYAWKVKTEPESEKTAFIVAKRQMFDSANIYKQQWLVNAQPNTMAQPWGEISFTSKGWPYVMKNDQLDCEQWLSLLWAKKGIFGLNYQISKPIGMVNGRWCRYTYDHGQELDLKIINNNFKVNVIFP